MARATDHSGKTVPGGANYPDLVVLVMYDAARIPKFGNVTTLWPCVDAATPVVEKCASRRSEIRDSMKILDSLPAIVTVLH